MLKINKGNNKLVIFTEWLFSVEATRKMYTETGISMEYNSKKSQTLLSDWKTIKNNSKRGWW